MWSLEYLINNSSKTVSIEELSLKCLGIMKKHLYLLLLEPI